MAKGSKQSDRGNYPILTCTPRMLAPTKWVEAARTAVTINPVNRPAAERLGLIDPRVITPQHIAVMTTKYWTSGAVKLTVGFLDNAPTDLQKRILLHMNAWAETANVQFTLTKGAAQVRIARVADGYWSYLGTDILHIEPDQQTMNLQDFSMDTPESEFHRVVRHETGHTLGFPHEHMRQALVDLIDPDKAIKYFGETQGWSPEMVRAQVLTPIEESSLMGTDPPDPDSIMCYQIPGSITRSGEPIAGGTDIDPTDYGFAGKIYPNQKASAPAKSQAPRKSAPKKRAAARKRPRRG